MIRRDLKNMKKRRAAICFLMVFIMSFTLLPSGVFAAQNDSLKAKQQLAEQSRKFDEDKEKQEEETKASETSAKDALRIRQSRMRTPFACRSFLRKLLLTSTGL